MSGDDSSLSHRAPAQETVFRPFPLASPSGALYIERMFFLRPCINQSVHYLRLYRSLYSNKNGSNTQAGTADGQRPLPDPLHMSGGKSRKSSGRKIIDDRILGLLGRNDSTAGSLRCCTNRTRAPAKINQRLASRFCRLEAGSIRSSPIRPSD